ncbi:hypothetical protein FQN54_002517 [Arachnomyces sp. PD_36]|nr:hypothetical protein FQN54_002517 [Arachnomyces sp. PD_36]
MAQPKEAQIQDGVYLTDVEANVPETESPANSKNYSRPFAMPLYDPQNSNSERPPTNSSSSFGPVLSGSCTSHGEQVSGAEDMAVNVGPYRGDQNKAQSRLGIRRHPAQSIVSLTPSDLPGMSSSQSLSRRQMYELDRVVRHENGGVVPTPLSEDDEGENDEPPDGGFLAWAHALAGFLVTLNTHGLNMGFGMFQAYYEKQYLAKESPSKIAWIGSFQIFATFFMCLITSPLLNKGYFRLCFTGGSILMVVGLIAASFCNQWWQIMLAQGIAVGIGMGLSFSSGIVVLTSYFSSRLGVATSISAAGSPIGGILFPLVLKSLLQDIGFAWTMRVLALINIATMVPANIIARPRPTRRNAPRPEMDWAAFKDVPYVLMMAGMFFSFWGLYFGFYFIASYAQDVLDMEPNASVNLLVAMNAASFLGRFIPSLISDICIGPVNTVIPSAFLASVMIILWIGATSPLAMFLIGCAYGFVSAGVQSLYPSTVLSFNGPDRSKLGSRMGFVLATIGLGSLTGTPIGGRLISLGNGSYLYAELFAGSALALGALLLLAARVKKRGLEPVRV